MVSASKGTSSIASRDEDKATPHAEARSDGLLGQASPWDCEFCSHETSTSEQVAISGRNETLLFIEYDVATDGEIELVALINAVEQDDDDTDGEAWMTWRSTHADEGMGCVGVGRADLAAMESTEDSEELRAIIEGIILNDRATKEEVAP